MMKISQPAAQAAFALALLLLPLAAIPSASEAQAVPTAEVAPVSTGFALPSVAGSLQYALSASESVSSDSYGTPGVVPSTYLTGDLAFITSSQRDPFSMVFSGGHSWANSYQPSFTFFNLALSQTASVGRWAIVLADAVSYMPGTPSTGLSGIPGVGDLGATPLPAGANPGATGINPLPVPTSSGQGVLTGFSTQVDNTSSLSVQRQITGKTSLIASGSYFLMRFLGDTGGSTASITPGLDSDGDAASLGLNHRIDARTSVGGNYAYTRNTYSGYDFGTPMPAFSTQTASLLYTYQFTRKLATSLSAGPQWISIATPGNTPSLSLFANLSGTYTGKFSNASLVYTRNANSGYGVVDGSISSSVTFSATRSFDRVWLCAATAAYTQTTGLPSSISLPFSFHTTVAGAQVTRAIARSFSAFASYTVQNQSNQGAQAAVDLYSGLTQVAGFGITYSPAAVRIGHP